MYCAFVSSVHSVRVCLPLACHALIKVCVVAFLTFFLAVFIYVGMSLFLSCLPFSFHPDPPKRKKLTKNNFTVKRIAPCGSESRCSAAHVKRCQRLQSDKEQLGFVRKYAHALDPS